MGLYDLKKYWDKIFYLNITPDETLAYLTLYDPATIDINEDPNGEPRFFDEPFGVEHVLEYLKDHKIVYGLKTEYIEEAILHNSYYIPFIVAEGIPFTEGRDGYYEFHFETNPETKPIILEDGSVDYNKLGKIQLVEEGTHIATYFPAMQGKEGINVYGKPLLPKKEKELPPLGGKGFYIVQNENDAEYFAETEGKVEFKNGKLSVLPIYIVDGDVDATIGEIVFNGDVLVRGNVSAHPTIRATGSITIEGHVEIATLIAGKDILLKNGMQGAGKSYVYAKGDVSAKFFEQTMVITEGNIRANAIMNCELDANKAVIVSGKWGIIIGGVTYATEKVEAFNIGNKVGVLTRIHIGIPENFLDIMYVIDTKIKQIREQLEEIDKEYQRLNSKVGQKANELLVVKRNEYMRQKISIQAYLNELIKRKRACLDREERSINGTVFIQRHLYTNTKICINGVAQLIAGDCKNVTVKQSQNELHIYSNVPI